MSDAPQSAAGLRVRWLAHDRDGNVLARGETTASIAPQEVKSLGPIAIDVPEKSLGGPILVELRLEDATAKLLVERVQIFGSAEVSGPFAGLLNSRVDTQPAGSGRPIRRTTLQVTAATPRIEADQEVLELTVTNAGSMTALFCEPHPMLVYRTDLLIDNNHCFIPPGETRRITIRAQSTPQDGLSLARTGWTLSTWNADDVAIPPCKEALLSIGRRDKMCREFAGYSDGRQAKSDATTTLVGDRPNADVLPYRLTAAGEARFEFACTEAQANRAARLRLHTADQSETTATVVTLTINGRTIHKTLPKGLGIQRTDPAHLAFPATLEFDLSDADLHPGKNTLTVRVQDDGWFSWDALDLSPRK